ncbi:aspartate aminotransferase family protein [Lentibacillus sediminis]|uniref:aspartate aminotransferase family protein n=1 Tax=Lentibacillus sediminis TaxID=1940529 RepID=UPI000C1BFAB7|nr:aspartate aminotransferase family protein [Lentibacillus sediminis]
MARVEEKQTWTDRDRQNVWHHISPYDKTKPPKIVSQAKGSWISDQHGNRYLDGMAGLWSVNVGYGREELAQAGYEQMMKMSYTPMTNSHEPAIELAEKLNSMLGHEYMFFYSNSGSDANEVAFKMARQYHRQTGDPYKHKIISRYRGYHGNSMGALAATGQALRKYKFEPLSTGFLHVSPPDNYRRPAGMSIKEHNIQCADELEKKIIWEQKDTIAAVIIEPVITGGGVLTPHSEYLGRVQEICNKYEVILIIDEVICGFGRTGKMFGHEHYGIKPDIITMAKGLTSSYLPLSITAVKKEIYEAFIEEGPENHFRHVNTFGGNPAACAVALKNIEIIENENLVERSAELGARLTNELKGLRDHPYVGDIRSLGFMMGIELVENKETKEPASAARVGRILAECKANGLVIGKNGDTVQGFNNVLTISPPLSSTDDDVEFMIAVLKKVFKDNEI